MKVYKLHLKRYKKEGDQWTLDFSKQDMVSHERIRNLKESKSHLRNQGFKFIRLRERELSYISKDDHHLFIITWNQPEEIEKTRKEGKTNEVCEDQCASFGG